MAKRDVEQLAVKLASELAKLGDRKKRGVKLAPDPVQVYSDHVRTTRKMEFVSTGHHALDRILGGGIPVGRTIEIYGPYSSGKSVLLHEIIAQAQALGGLGMIKDPESTLDEPFAVRIGVNPRALLHNEPDTVEDVFQEVWDAETTLRKLDEDILFVIGLDSLAATSTKHEMEDFDKADMTKAKVISAGFRRITRLIARERTIFVVVNQTRQKIGVMFGNPETTSGGDALGFHASQRIRISQGVLYKGHKRKIFDHGQPVAGRAVVEVVKNKVGAPFKKCEVILNFTDGLVAWSGFADLLADEERIKRVGESFEYEKRRFEWYEIEDVLEKHPEILGEGDE
jgi:recombination protein RecA